MKVRELRDALSSMDGSLDVRVLVYSKNELDKYRYASCLSFDNIAGAEISNDAAGSSVASIVN